MYFLEELPAMCQDLAPFIRLVKNGIIPVIQIVIPIILIVLGMFDLGKAVVASKEDEIKAAQKLLIKRIIYAILIFMIVLIIKTVFNIVVGSGTEVNKKEVTNWWNCYSNIK